MWTASHQQHVESYGTDLSCDTNCKRQKSSRTVHLFLGILIYMCYSSQLYLSCIYTYHSSFEVIRVECDIFGMFGPAYKTRNTLDQYRIIQEEKSSNHR